MRSFVFKLRGAVSFLERGAPAGSEALVSSRASMLRRNAALVKSGASQRIDRAPLLSSARCLPTSRESLFVCRASCLAGDASLL
jgi:hypothetical protein